MELATSESNATPSASSTAVALGCRPSAAPPVPNVEDRSIQACRQSFTFIEEAALVLGYLAHDASGPTKATKKPVQGRSLEAVDSIVVAATRIWANGSMEAMTTNAVADGCRCQHWLPLPIYPSQAGHSGRRIGASFEARGRFFLIRMAEAKPQVLRGKVRTLLSIPLEFRPDHNELHLALSEELPPIGHYSALQNSVRRGAEPLRSLLESHVDEINRANLPLVCHVLINAIHSVTHHGILPRDPSMTDEAFVEELTHMVMGYLTDPHPKP